MENTILTAKKGKGLDDVLGSFIPSPVDEMKKMIVGANKFQIFLEKYLRLLQLPRGYPSLSYHYQSLLEKMDEVLSPAEIVVFQRITSIFDERDSYRGRTGHVLTKLIENSYLAGYNDFTVESDKSPVVYIGEYGLDHHTHYLLGKEEDPLRITVEGNTLFLGQRNENVEYTVKGLVRHCGDYARRSSFRLQQVEGSVGALVVDCAFEIGEIIPNTISPIYFLDAKGCTIKTPDERTLQLLSQHLPSGNKLYFVHADGTEKLVEERS